MFKKILILLSALSITACHCAYNACNHDASCNYSSDRFENNQHEVFFAFDSSDLDSEARKMLDLQVSWLKNNPEIKAVIEGYCDARGGEKYNIILGKKRALVVKKYLVNNGIDAKRLKTVSYGKDRPFVSGSSEEAWAQNRRSVTITEQ